ncbi:MAG: TRAP transporter large permease subunit [Myxococcota bacterium]
MTIPLVATLAALVIAAVVFLRNKPVAAVAFIAVATIPLMFGSPAASLILGAITLAILLAQPLFVILGGVTLLCFEFLAEVPPLDYGIFPEKIFELTDKNVLLAIPFFIISGAIMTHGGIAARLINFAKELTSWLPGGLAIAAVAGCVLFGAISGSSPVTVIAIGGMMFPALTKAGFDDKISLGLLTSAGSLGIVIPPSIPMIVYAIVVSGQQTVDVGDLFIAGLGPGLLMGALLSSYIIVQSLRASEDWTSEIRTMARGLAVVASPLVIGEIVAAAIGPWGRIAGLGLLVALMVYAGRRAFLDGFWALLLPVVILGGIYTGFFTPTEAAAVAVVYALVVELFIHREMTLKDIPSIFAESTVMMGALTLILVIAFVFNDFLVEEKIPDQAVAWIADAELSRATFLITLNVFLLAVGCFMDILSAILIIAPLIAPMAAALGIDPIHLGLIFIVNLEVGYLTPPLGLNLFVASTLFQRSLGEVVRSVVPFTALMLVGIASVTYIPAIALGPGWLVASLSATDVDEASHDEPDEDQEDDAGDAGDAGVKTIEELMNEASGENDDEDAEDSKVKTIEELMNEADESEDEQDPNEQEPPSGPVKTIEELMNEAGVNDGD